jgi:putative glutamine amidotransferase
VSNRPIIAITSYAAPARWGAWKLPAALIPLDYVDAVAAAGGRPIVIPPMLEGVAETLAIADGLVLSGGPDIDPRNYGATLAGADTEVRPERDAAELALLRLALERDLPVLGVCRGMQLINVARGGSLVQHLPDVVHHVGHRTEPGRFDVHTVKIRGRSRTGEILGDRVSVCSAHHQGIATVGEGLIATAWAEDESIEAIEDPTKTFVVGVLWHPEGGQDNSLFVALVEAARRGGRHGELTMAVGGPGARVG